MHESSALRVNGLPGRTRRNHNALRQAITRFSTGFCDLRHNEDRQQLVTIHSEDRQQLVTIHSEDRRQPELIHILIACVLEVLCYSPWANKMISFTVHKLCKPCQVHQPHLHSIPNLNTLEVHLLPLDC